MATHFTQRPPDAPEPQDIRDSESTVSLIRRLMDEISTLFRQEIALARNEVTGSLVTFLSGLGSMGAGGALLFAGLLALVASAVLGLALVMAPWLAALIVGVVTGVVGYILLHAGRKRLDPSVLKPTRSPDSLRQDKEVLTGRRP